MTLTQDIERTDDACRRAVLAQAVAALSAVAAWRRGEEPGVVAGVMFDAKAAAMQAHAVAVLACRIRREMTKADADTKGTADRAVDCARLAEQSAKDAATHRVVVPRPDPEDVRQMMEALAAVGGKVSTVIHEG